MSVVEFFIGFGVVVAGSCTMLFVLYAWYRFWYNIAEKESPDESADGHERDALFLSIFAGLIVFGVVLVLVISAPIGRSVVVWLRGR